MGEKYYVVRVVLKEKEEFSLNALGDGFLFLAYLMESENGDYEIFPATWCLCDEMDSRQPMLITFFKIFIRILFKEKDEICYSEHYYQEVNNNMEIFCEEKDYTTLEEETENNFKILIFRGEEYNSYLKIIFLDSLDDEDLQIMIKDYSEQMHNIYL